MSTTVDRPAEGRFSRDIPSDVLGPVPIKDLPEPLPLRKVLGPGVILLATALGSGEYVLWPFISAHIGLTILWAAIVAVAIQFFINMEVERYTHATGETAITGFTRLWKPWWALFIVMAVVPNVWPGFATGAAACLSFVVGDLNVQLVGILGLVAVGITLTASPVVYQTVEKIQTVVIVAVIIWLVLAVFLGTTSEAWGDLVSGFGSFGSIKTNDAVTAAALAGAIAFAGSGGCGNLAVSNWVRDKGMGMGAYIPRIVSPMSGEQEAVPSKGTTFEPDEENMRRWRGWWKVANTEQAVTFWLIGTLGIVILSVLAYSTVFIVVGIAILLLFTDQPLVLLVIGSALSAIVMFVYSILLIVLNRGNLPRAIRLGGYRMWIMGFAVLWFGYFSVRVVIAYGKQLF